MLMEHDRIILTSDLAEHGSLAGAVGTIIHVYSGGHALEVEFSPAGDTPSAVATVRPSQARPVSGAGNQDIGKTLDLGVETGPIAPISRSKDTLGQPRMPKQPMDTITYDLKKGQRVVYKGTTNDPKAREAKHRADGKDFDRLVQTSRRMTADGAKEKEARALDTYRRGHSGQNPRYNRTDDG